MADPLGPSPATEAPQPITLSDDALVKIGEGEPVKWSDYQKGFVSRSDVGALDARERAVQLGETYLLEQAKQIDARIRGTSRPTQPPRTEARDPYAKLRGLPAIDGDTAIELAETLTKQGLAPIAQIIQRLAAQVEAQRAQLEGVRGHVSGAEERTREEAFTHSVGTILRDLKLDAAAAPVLQEFARDVYLSYDPTDGKLDKEFPQIFQSRFKALREFFRGLESSEAERSRADAKAAFFSSKRGKTTPSQPAKPAFESPRDLARTFHQLTSRT